MYVIRTGLKIQLEKLIYRFNLQHFNHSRFFLLKVNLLKENEKFTNLFEKCYKREMLKHSQVTQLKC